MVYKLYYSKTKINNTKKSSLRLGSQLHFLLGKMMQTRQVKGDYISLAKKKK